MAKYTGRSTSVFLSLSFLLLTAGIASCSPGIEPADMVLLNGNIVTVDSQQPAVESLAVKGDRIVWTGSNETAGLHIGPATQVIDLGGRLVVPGFIEGHAHFRGIGESKLQLDLTMAANWDDIVGMVQKAAEERKDGEWILGRGWHQEKWRIVPKPSIGGLPLHDKLSQAAPRNPVLLTHASGHAVFANAKAMELAGIDSRTADPPGGQIVRDLQGRPIGVFRETAQALFSAALNRDRSNLTAAEREAFLTKIVRLASQECLSKGITSFHDAGASFEFADFLKEKAVQGQLPIRVYLMLNESNADLAQRLSEYRWINVENHRLTVRSIKRFMDGALGAHGAWLLEPYEDLKSSSGLNTTSLESLAETAELAIRNGFQLCVHAIGDRANQETLDIFEEAFRRYPERNDLRWRVEHAQHLAAGDIARFSQLGVIASMQPIHATSDGPWVIRRLGEIRAREGAYAWRKLLDSGAVIACGTDAPVESIDPIQNFYAAVSRRMKNGKEFFPEQCMSREEALRSLTLNCAFAAFEEADKGTLTPGKLADITVLSKDIMSVPIEEIPDTRVVYTIIGGRVAWSPTGD